MPGAASLILSLWRLESSYTTVSYIVPYTFMLLWEVVGTGSSLSILLLLHHTEKMLVTECSGGRKWQQQ
jgi:hypothetical protein